MRCVGVCPTQAISIEADTDGAVVKLDRGKCIGCNACVSACSTATITRDLSTRIASRTREGLVLTNRHAATPDQPSAPSPFLRSLQIREVSTGDNSVDQEVNASTNPIFDISRFGISFVASPRFADALLVTGPVGNAMQEPLLRCYEAMAEPRLVIAAGTDAISGGLHRGGCAGTNGICDLPVDIYIPGAPPHPWSIIHGIMLAMGRKIE